MDILPAKDGTDNHQWLELAHQCAADESARIAELARGGRDSSNVEAKQIADGIRALERRRRELGVDPATGDKTGNTPFGVAESDYRLQGENLNTAVSRVENAVRARDPYRLRLTVYTNVAAAINKHDSKLIAANYLYWIVQHRAREIGRDKFTVAELREYLAGLGIQWSDRRIRDAIGRGVGLLWNKAQRDRRDGRQWVYAMRSKERVMAALDARDPGARVLIQDAAWRVDDMRQWRAFVWSAFAPNHPGNGKLSRETLARQFGVSRRTSRSYETDHNTQANVKHRVSAARVQRGNYDASMEIASHETGFAFYRKEQWYHRKRRRKYASLWRVWQDVNFYDFDSTRLSVSNRRRYIKAGVQALDAENVRINPVDGRASDQGSSETPRLARRFDDPQKARKYRKRNPDRPTKLFMQSDRRTDLLTRGAIGGDHVWEFTASNAALGLG